MALEIEQLDSLRRSESWSDLSFLVASKHDLEKEEVFRRIRRICGEKFENSKVLIDWSFEIMSNWKLVDGFTDPVLALLILMMLSSYPSNCHLDTLSECKVSEELCTELVTLLLELKDTEIDSLWMGFSRRREDYQKIDWQEKSIQWTKIIKEKWVDTFLASRGYLPILALGAKILLHSSPGKLHEVLTQQNYPLILLSLGWFVPRSYLLKAAATRQTQAGLLLFHLGTITSSNVDRFRLTPLSPIYTSVEKHFIKEALFAASRDKDTWDLWCKIFFDMQSLGLVLGETLAAEKISSEAREIFLENLPFERHFIMAKLRLRTLKDTYKEFEEHSSEEVQRDFYRQGFEIWKRHLESLQDIYLNDTISTVFDYLVARYLEISLTEDQFNVKARELILEMTNIDSVWFKDLSSYNCYFYRLLTKWQFYSGEWDSSNLIDTQLGNNTYSVFPPEFGTYYQMKFHWHPVQEG